MTHLLEWPLRELKNFRTIEKSAEDNAPATAIFAAPSALEREIEKDYGVKVLGRVLEVRETFYVISRERRIRDPVVAAIFSAAQSPFLPAHRRGEGGDGVAVVARCSPSSLRPSDELEQHRNVSMPFDGVP